jgi:uncharacterized delta-60 repeat protein
MKMQKPSYINRLDRKKHHARRVMVLTMIALLSYFSTLDRVQAADGDLDKSFGARGMVVTEFSNSQSVARAIAIQGDGKIVAAGGIGNNAVAVAGFALVRYNSDGSLDASFGVGGKLTTQFDGGGSAAAIAIQSDGKIVAGGFAGVLPNSSFALVRYNSDGSLDTGFGASGKVTTPFGAGSRVNAITIQPDGKIVAAGFAGELNKASSFAVARYNGDGSLDASFGTSGMVTTGLLDSSDANAIATQSDGKIVLAGHASTINAQRVSFFGLARYDRDGSLDTSFGTGGKVTTSLVGFPGVFSSAVAVVLTPDGKIVAAGTASLGGVGRASFVALAHYNSDGSLDTSFGAGGTAVTAFLDSQSIARAIAFRPDGKTVAVGATFKSKGSVFALARYNNDGTPDKNFGADGKVITSFTDESDDDANAVAIQSDGKIVAGGISYELNSDFGLARYNAEPNFALDFSTSQVDAERGTKVRVTLNINRTGGFADNVTITHSDTSALNIKGLPDSISTIDNSVSFKLKIKAGAPTGQQQVTFTGKSDSGMERTTTLSLVIH